MAIGDKQKCVALLKSNLLVTLTLFGAIIGFTIGFAVRSLQPTKDALMWIGESFISCFYKLADSCDKKHC